MDMMYDFNENSNLLLMFGSYYTFVNIHVSYMGLWIFIAEIEVINIHNFVIIFERLCLPVLCYVVHTNISIIETGFPTTLLFRTLPVILSRDYILLKYYVIYSKSWPCSIYIKSTFTQT